MANPASFPYSQSSLQAYDNCQRLFYLRYVQKLDWPALVSEDSVAFEASRKAGLFFHQLIQQVFLGVELARLRKLADNYPLSAMTRWFDNFLEGGYLSLEGENACEWQISVQFGEQILTAKYDLVHFGQTKATIYDWKTSTRIPHVNTLKKKLQSHVFPLVLNIWMEQNHRPQKANIEMVYWEAEQPDAPVSLHFDAAARTASASKISGLINAIEQSYQEGFPKTQDIKWCKYCQFQTYCERKGSDTVEASDEHAVLYAQSLDNIGFNDEFTGE
mgnify:CR=1 FL=1